MGFAIREDSPLWTRFYGGPGDPPEGTRRVVPLYDLSESPFCCAGPDVDGDYFHYIRRGDGSTREFNYVGRCAVVDGPHLRAHG